MSLQLISPFDILKDYEKEDVEMFNQAMKEHLADEKETMANEMVAIRYRQDDFMRDILSGKDDRDFSE